MATNTLITRDFDEQIDDSSWEDISDGEVEEEQDVARNDPFTTQNKMKPWHRQKRRNYERKRHQTTSLTTGLRKDGRARRDIDIERNRASHFMHPPIDFTRRQIRLVRILPTDIASPIQCEFVLGMVDDPAQPYTALSYVWGTAGMGSDVAKIFLDGQDFWMRWNLWDFLHRARMDQSLCQGLFWIDALCIDQAGNGINGFQEKNHQVNMMKDIYSNAREVISWLGEPRLDAKGRLELENLQDYLATKISLDEESAFRALYYITYCPYWSRMWIVQEILLAKRVIIRLGNFSFNWQELCELWLEDNYAEWARSTGVDDGGPLSKFDFNVSYILITRWRKARPIIHTYMNKNSPKRNPSFMGTFLIFQHQECSNPLDKIYGLLGLLEHQPIVADYNKTPVQLFEDVFRQFYFYLSDERDPYIDRGMMRALFGRLVLALGLSFEEKESVRWRLPILPYGGRPHGSPARYVDYRNV